MKNYERKIKRMKDREKVKDWTKIKRLERSKKKKTLSKKGEDNREILSKTLFRGVKNCIKKRQKTMMTLKQIWCNKFL